MISVKLSTPIKAHDEELSELVLNDPSYEQIQQLGIPVKVDSAGEYTVNGQVAIRYIPVLANVPPSSIKNLGPYDLNNLCWAVWRFFMTPPEMIQTK